MLKIFQVCAIYSPVLMQCVAIRFWLQPCVISAPGFVLLKECSQDHANLWNGYTVSGAVASVYWTCVCLLLTWSITILISNQFFVTYQFFFIMASCLRFYIKNLLAHAQNGSKPFRSLDLIKIYRELELMTRLFNRINQNGFISNIIFLLGVSFVISLFAFITIKDAMPILQFVIMASALVQTYICLLVGYGIFGGLYDDSSQTLKAFKSPNFNLGTRNERKVVTKLIYSLQPLKVMIGSVNFVDKLTPVTLIDFCIQQLVSILLL